MIALGAICVFFFLGATAVLLSRPGGEPRRPLRETLLIACIIWALWLVAGTELLSLGEWLRRWPLVAWWSLPTAVIAAVAFRDRDRLVALWRQLPDRRPDWLTLGLVASVVVILVTLGAVAAVTPPNNWDSQTYHLPRQVYWMQQASVAHYPTYHLRQIVMPPMAEYVGVHFMILTGDDHWANLVQWFALVMTVVAASLIARELGAGPRGQSLAALLVVANPIAAMQAVNTKNDLVVALWACTMALFMLKVWITRSCPPRWTAVIGASLGLMLLTKGTGFIYGLPISAAAGVAILVVQRWRGLLTGLAIGALALSINAGHFARNIIDFGSPLGVSQQGAGTDLMNEIFSPAAIMSNVVRNLALHVGTPSQDLNAEIESAIARLHQQWLGIGPGDPRTTFLNQQFQVLYRPFAEDEAPAPVHLVLALLVVPVLLLFRRGNRLLLVYDAVVCACFLLFCIVLRWQPWHARLHLPLVSLFCPVAGALLERGWRGMPAAATAAVALVVLTPSILWNNQKPLLGSPSIFTATRLENMVRTRPRLLEPLRCMVEASKELKPRTVAIWPIGDGWQYFVQRALLRSLDQPPNFVGLLNHPASRRPHRIPRPDIIIRINDPLIQFTHSGDVYVAAKYCDVIYTVYIPREVASAGGLKAPAPPPFVGWQHVDGLGEVEGPYPDRDLPEVRWGLGPATTLLFDSDGGPATLFIEGRPDQRPDQTITVRLNGWLVYKHAFGPQLLFQDLKIPLNPERGRNVLAIEYGNWEPSQDGRRLGVLYRRLQIVPDAFRVGAPIVNGSGGGSQSPLTSPRAHELMAVSAPQRDGGGGGLSDREIPRRRSLKSRCRRQGGRRLHSGAGTVDC